MVDRLEGHQVRDPQALRTNVEVQLDQAADEVARRFSGRVEYDTVRQVVSEAYEDLAGKAKVNSFLPILAARSAQQRLEDGDEDEQAEDRRVGAGEGAHADGGHGGEGGRNTP